MLTNHYPRVALAHTPTPLECLTNLSDHLGGPRIWAKRDDCTGLAMGGNKARQLEFYIGDAIANGADTLLTTGATQSNHVRMTVAAARKLGLEVEVQLEKRVEGRQQAYYDSGNPFLIKLMGARIHFYPEGGDEAGADKAMEDRAEALRQEGRKPYIIPLSGSHTPYGALGYVKAAEEMMQQFAAQSLQVSGIALASGSATTHSGLLAGIKALGSDIPVYGFCIRRDQVAQRERVLAKSQKVAEMIGHANAVSDNDVLLDDGMLAPGYGQLNEGCLEAMKLAALNEGLLLDPTYTGKSMAGLIDMIRQGRLGLDENVVFLHSGGSPALFGYPELVD